MSADNYSIKNNKINNNIGSNIQKDKSNLNKNTRYCKECKDYTVHWENSHYTRNPRVGLDGTETDDKKKTIEEKITQWICSICKTTFVELPPNLLPRKHFEVNSIYNELSYLFYDTASKKSYSKRKFDVLSHLDCCERTLDSYIILFFNNYNRIENFLRKKITTFEPTFSIKDLMKEKENNLKVNNLYPDCHYQDESKDIFKKCSTLIILGLTFFKINQRHTPYFHYTEQKIGELINHKLYLRYRCFLL